MWWPASYTLLHFKWLQGYEDDVISNNEWSVQDIKDLNFMARMAWARRYGIV